MDYYLSTYTLSLSQYISVDLNGRFDCFHSHWNETIHEHTQGASTWIHSTILEFFDACFLFLWVHYTLFLAKELLQWILYFHNFQVWYHPLVKYLQINIGLNSCFQLKNFEGLYMTYLSWSNSDSILVINANYLSAAFVN